MPHLHYKANKINALEMSSLTKDAYTNELKPLRSCEDRLALLEKLSMTIELKPLLATYTAEVCRLIPVSGLEFEYQGDKLQLKYSKASSCDLVNQLTFGHEEIGRVSYFSTKPLSKHQRRLLCAVEQQLLQPLFNVLRYEHSRRLSMKDFLTGLSNRNYFEDMMSHMIATSNREQRSFTLLFVDLDNFKAVNDNHGHIEGDNVLIEFSTRLNLAVRNNDHIFRFGGDEFAILLAHSDNLHPELVAQRIIKLTNDSQLISEHRVTASIGYANWQPQDTGNMLTDRADKALYKVKHQGKNGYSAAG